jgi:serine/threonine protein kinase
MPEMLGKFELVRLIAQGGMADVYLARQCDLDRLVAVKILDEDRVGDPDARALFLDEARLGTLLSHPNLSIVYDVAAAGGTYYLAMEYLDGADLRDVLVAAGGPIAPPTALAIVTAAASGLEHAHGMRVVHRDVSLTNIMVTRDGQVKVIDFGIASARASTHVTLPGTVRGKTHYMAPEQCLGDPIDARADVFALGIVLYELVTGERCFVGTTDLECMLAIVRGEYVPPHVTNPDLPLDLAHVIVRALAIDPARRYATAQELIDALACVAARHGWCAGAREIAELTSELSRVNKRDEEPTVTLRPHAA